jgi:UDP-glucose 4-epimerase
MGRIAVTGTSSFLGARILRRLAELHGGERIVAIDIAAPPAALRGVRHALVDLTLPAADQRLLEVFREDEVESVVHAAFFGEPRRDTAYAHELESIGTLNLAAAAAAAGVEQLVVRSFTAVYGAHGQNPNFLREEHPPRAQSPLQWVRDKLEAERHAQAYAERYPRLTVTLLRFAPLLGPGVRSFYARYFSRRVVSLLMGYDPLVQLLHPEDALEALLLALQARKPGVFNVAPRDTLSLRTAAHLADKLVVSVPHPVAYAAAELAWAAGVGVAPAGFVDYGRYPFVADGEKARRELGFVARYGSRESLEQYLGYRYPQRYARAARPVDAGEVAG